MSYATKRSKHLCEDILQRNVLDLNCSEFDLNVCWGEAGVRPSITLPVHYKTTLQTANAANHHEPVHSPQLRNAFHMDSASSFLEKKAIRNSLLGKVFKKTASKKKSSEPRPKSNNLTRRAAELRFEGNKKRQEELPNK